MWIAVFSLAKTLTVVIVRKKFAGEWRGNPWRHTTDGVDCHAVARKDGQKRMVWVACLRRHVLCDSRREDE